MTSQQTLTYDKCDAIISYSNLSLYHRIGLYFIVTGVYFYLTRTFLSLTPGPTVVPTTSLAPTMTPAPTTACPDGQWERSPPDGHCYASCHQGGNDQLGPCGDGTSANCCHQRPRVGKFHTGNQDPTFRGEIAHYPVESSAKSRLFTELGKEKHGKVQTLLWKIQVFTEITKSQVATTPTIHNGQTISTENQTASVLLTLVRLASGNDLRQTATATLPVDR